MLLYLAVVGYRQCMLYCEGQHVVCVAAVTSQLCVVFISFCSGSIDSWTVVILVRLGSWVWVLACDRDRIGSCGKWPTKSTRYLTYFPLYLKNTNAIEHMLYGEGVSCVGKKLELSVETWSLPPPHTTERERERGGGGNQGKNDRANGHCVEWEYATDQTRWRNSDRSDWLWARS